MTVTTESVDCAVVQVAATVVDPMVRVKLAVLSDWLLDKETVEAGGATVESDVTVELSETAVTQLVGEATVLPVNVSTVV